MRPFGRTAWGCALLLLAAGASPAEAAWCNVFQVCCFGCRSRPTVSAYAPYIACAPPCCPQQVCTTRYVQRCAYQPVTTYESRTYYEPVTTYRTSYYYEPVTSYRYSCYYDPCTCSYQQVASPVTSYRLRSQCCPVQSFVARCCSVPVTSYRQSFYYEPVTSCCTTGYVPAAPPCNGSGQPAVGESPSTPQPGVRDFSESQKNTNPPPTNNPNGVSFRQLPPLSVPSRTAPPPAAPPPAVKLERIVYAPSSNVEGQIVRDDSAPRPGARLHFVSAEQQAQRETVTADATGQFRLTLASGGWLVYTESADGKQLFHSKIDVQENQTRRMTLVSR